MPFCLVESRNHFFSLNNRSDGDFFGDILNKVFETSQTKDVILILQDSLLDRQADDILRKISATTIQQVPSLYVYADRTEPQFQVSSYLMSRDLIVYIYVSEHEPDIVEGKLIAENIIRFIHKRVRSKILILMILRQPCRDLAPLFREIWSRKILDTIIVEYSKSEYSNKYSTLVHRFNPFADYFIKEPYSENITWFTDDFPNMQNYPLVYAIGHRLPYTDILLDSKGNVREIKGVDQMVIRTVAEKMNFTAIPKIILNAVFLEVMPNGTKHGIILGLTSGEYDAILNTIPMFVYGMHSDVEVTSAINIEDWCFVVPRLHMRYFSGMTVILVFLVSFMIVGTFWIYSRLMKFNSNRWHPMRIIGIMLDRSFPSVPRRIHERIIFLSIFAACSCYSSTIFAQLTRISLERDRHAQFPRLQDLMDSDLVPMVHRNILDIIVKYNDILEYYINTSNKKFVEVTMMDKCLKDILKYQNVSCFMELNWAKLIAFSNMRNGDTIMDKTKLCYLSVPAGNMFPKGSPYVKRISDLLLTLGEAGLYNKWHTDYMSSEMKGTISHLHRNQKNNSIYVNVLMPLFYVLISGYLISAFIFIGELLWKYFGINSHW